MALPDHHYSVSPDVLSKTIDGEAVLLNLSSGTYLGLNKVGTRVWELLSEGRNVGAIATALLLEFDVPRDVLEKDLSDILTEMSNKGLLISSPQT